MNVGFIESATKANHKRAYLNRLNDNVNAMKEAFFNLFVYLLLFFFYFFCFSFFGSQNVLGLERPTYSSGLHSSGCRPRSY